jgi:molecular chaperone GrpE
MEHAHADEHAEAHGAEPVSAADTVTMPVDEFERFKSEVAQAQGYLEGWKRERAEFANYKRRIERETKDTYQNASTDVLKNFLPVIDDFERALANAPADLAGTPWFEGTSAILRKMHGVLDTFGVTVVDPTGQPFDPNLHQAIAVSEATDQHPADTVTETLQKGYAVGDRVLRAAFVKVAK